MRTFWMRLSVACLLGLGGSAAARGGDYFFAFGGGYAPPGNQVSLEKNLLYFQRFLKLKRLDSAPQYYLFADGNEPNRDLQYDDPGQRPSQLRSTLAKIFRQDRGIEFNYRTNRVPRLSGHCAIDTIDVWFNNTGSKLKPGDRLFVYFTGHGGRGPEKDPLNTTLQTWFGQTYSVKEFTQRLNKIPPQVPVVLVMVQCYAGGFANVIFKDGDPAQGIALQPRAGFFATIPEQQAAGCTPDINEANYLEYSSYFWAALCGENRLGEKVEPPDYNGDGRVDFSEAHTYAILSDDSIDLPIKTSDVLLRLVSAAYPEKTLDQSVADRYVTPEIYSRLIAVAAPCDRAVLEGFSAMFGLSGERRTQQARDVADEALKKQDDVGNRKNKLSEEFNQSATLLAHYLQEAWPELDNAWHPRFEQILREDGAAIWANIERHPRFAKLQELEKQIQALEKEHRDLQCRWARCQRFLYRTESIARGANLPLVATADVQQHYHRLIDLETGTLPSPTGAPQGTPAGPPKNQQHKSDSVDKGARGGDFRGGDFRGGPPNRSAPSGKEPTTDAP